MELLQNSQAGWDEAKPQQNNYHHIIFHKKKKTTQPVLNVVFLQFVWLKCALHSCNKNTILTIVSSEVGQTVLCGGSPAKQAFLCATFWIKALIECNKTFQGYLQFIPRQWAWFPPKTSPVSSLPSKPTPQAYTSLFLAFFSLGKGYFHWVMRPTSPDMKVR